MCRFLDAKIAQDAYVTWIYNKVPSNQLTLPPIVNTKMDTNKSYV